MPAATTSSRASPAGRRSTACAERPTPRTRCGAASSTTFTISTTGRLPSTCRSWAAPSSLGGPIGTPIDPSARARAPRAAPLSPPHRHRLQRLRLMMGREERMDGSVGGTDRMILRREGSTGWMLFNNPARHNAVSLYIWDILGAFEGDDDIRCVVVAGAGGKAFVSGADISEFAEKRSTRDTIAHYNSVGERA